MEIGQNLWVSGVTKGMGKRGEFKISLSNRKSGEILNSTKSDRVKMDWVIRGERRVF